MGQNSHDVHGLGSAELSPSEHLSWCKEDFSEVVYLQFLGMGPFCISLVIKSTVQMPASLSIVVSLHLVVKRAFISASSQGLRSALTVVQ